MLITVIIVCLPIKLHISHSNAGLDPTEIYGVGWGREGGRVQEKFAAKVVRGCIKNFIQNQTNAGFEAQQR